MLLLAILLLISYFWKTETLPTKEGCGAYSHGEQWINATLPCVSYRCKDGVTYPRYTGCVWRNQCYDIDQTWEKDCAHITCVSYKANNVTYFRVKAKLGCSWKGQCMPGNTVWNDDCDIYRCAVTVTEQSQSAKVETVQTRCRLGNKCFNNSATWFEQCTWYKCEIRTSMGQTAKKVAGVPGCLHNNICYIVGKVRTDPENCASYECVQGNGQVQWKQTVFGCRYNGSCLPANSTRTDKKLCMKWTCERSPGSIKAVLTGKSNGCLHQKVCRAVGELWLMRKPCLELVCALDEVGEHTISVKRSLCKDKFGACHEWGRKGISMMVNGTSYENCSCMKKSKRFSSVICQSPLKKLLN